MSTIYNPEAETITQIEKMELESRDIRRRIEHAHTQEDKRVLNKQLEELKAKIEFLKTRLP